MTKEFVEVDKVVGEVSWLGHIILGETPEDKLNQIIDKLDHSTGLEVEIIVNGVSISYDNFQSQLDKWCEQIEEQLKEKLEYMQKEKYVVEKAEQLIKDKLGNIQDALYDIENSLWKLGE
jgi:hypothetical protein